MVQDRASEDRVLSGVRVLDFGRYVAGPYCSSLLADLGADVIRIERLAGSEDRYIGAIREGGEGSVFLQLNRGKRCMTLNPTKDEGREIVRRLVESADVVVANVPPDALASMGLDYATLKAIREDIILCSSTAFGDNGPYMNRPGYDSVAQVMSGGTIMTGPPGTPIKSAVSWVDCGTGLSAAFGTMAALMHRARTGRGQEVKTSLLHTAMSFFHYFNLEAQLMGRVRTPVPNQSYVCAPSDIFHAKDGSLMVTVMGQPMFERWCTLVDQRHWLEDPRYATDAQRGADAAIFCEIMQRWIAEHSVAEALERLDAARIPSAPVLSPLEALVNPQVLATNMLQEVDYPGLGPMPLMRAPVSFSDIDTSIRSRPPTLGEHTDEVLGSVGYSAEQIAGFRARRVI